MASSPGNSLAVRVTAFFIRCCGFWAEDMELGRRIMDGINKYSICAVAFALYVTVTDLCHCYGDLEKFSYCGLNVTIVGFGLVKLLIFTRKRKQFLNIIYHAKKHYWFCDYDDYGAGVMNKCMTRCAGIIIFAVSVCHLTIIIYNVKPLMDNRGQNESQRVLPFPLWIDFPVSLTPWYEILYTIETFSSYHCCICYFCFDNFLNLINITLVGQFLILSKEFQDIYDEHNTLLSTDNNYTRARFVRCVKKHQQLTEFTEDVNELYSDVILGMVIILTFLLCIELYQLMTDVGEPLARILYCSYVGGDFTQLYFFILTCNDLTEASLGISDAAYAVRWFAVESKTEERNALTKDLQFVIMRSQKASSLTVGSFAPVTLMTFTAICNRAFSFLTLIRKCLD